MSSWAVELEARSKKREEMTNLRTAKAIQDRQTLNQKTPTLWFEFMRELESKVKEFNAVCGIDRRLSLHANLPAFTLSRPTRKALIAGTLANDKLTIAGKNGLRHEADWRIKVTADGLDVWLFDSDDNPAELETFAIGLIERLLEQTDSE